MKIYAGRDRKKFILSFHQFIDWCETGHRAMWQNPDFVAMDRESFKELTGVKSIKKIKLPLKIKISRKYETMIEKQKSEQIDHANKN